MWEERFRANQWRAPIWGFLILKASTPDELDGVSFSQIQAEGDQFCGCITVVDFCFICCLTINVGTK